MDSATLFALPSDGIVLFLAGALFVGVAVRRQLAGAPKGTAWALVGVTVVGAVLRLLVSQPMQMVGPWANARIVPLAGAVLDGPVLAALTRTHPVYLTDVVFASTLGLAVLSPVAMFAHARALFRDDRTALAAAALLALLPMHIRFSRSDVAQMQTVAVSSLAFVALYGAMNDPSRRWRALCFVALPWLSLVTWQTRTENIVLLPLELGAVAIASRGVPRARAVAVAVVLSLTALYAVVAKQLAEYRHAADVDVVSSTVGALINLPDPWRDTLLHPWVTPPAVLAAAAFGAVLLWRRERRPQALLLLAWAALVALSQGSTHCDRVAAQSRYDVHYVVPLVLLAAVATREVLRWSPGRRALALALLVSAPLVHLSYERDVDYFEMHEFRFLTELRSVIPHGCTVLELRPARRPGELETSRVARVAELRLGGHHESAWTIVPSGALREGDEAEALSPEALAVLRHAPACLMVYEGLSCFSHRPLLSPIAPVCAALHERLSLSLVRERRVRSVWLDADAGVAGRERGRAPKVTPQALLDGAEVRFRLYRARPR